MQAWVVQQCGPIDSQTAGPDGAGLSRAEGRARYG